MRILLVHNRYSIRGGEDAVFDQECDLLRSNGHEVIEYTKDNRQIDNASLVKLAANSVWASDSYSEVARLIERSKPDVVHVHNTLPQVSPSVYYAAARHAVPVVQTLHNYRLLCPNGLLLRDSAVCEECVGRTIAWPAIRYKCYRESRPASAAVVVSLSLHKAIGTWSRKVTRYIALCQFAREKMLQAGLPPERVVVKPNFTRDRHTDADLNAVRGGGLFVGRLSEEKGLRVLIEAWRSLDVDLDVVGGGGPLSDQVRAAASKHFRPVGFVDDDALTQVMRRAAFIVMPSLVYEGFPMVVAESFAAGLPIIASRLGALAELVEDGRTGLHFNAGDQADLAAKVRWARDNPLRMAEMGQRARETYLQRYTPEANYERLVEVYHDAVAALRP
ncbi:glycosyltransferase family 4 protein [Methylibium sp.]|uniref:glycosyltransferase family 4 protein n=1 Tax=Methylibium sp. TaxID=2067992 RepID=UPI003D141086